ncbi:MAG: class I SAM-dependent methyltransferase [Xanthomarina sp.]
MSIIKYNCNLCKGEQFTERKSLTKSLGIKENEKYKVVSCNSCSLHSLHPIPNNKEFKEIYDNYAEHGDRIEVEKKRMETIYPEKIKLINQYGPNLKSILDIGAGNGGFVSIAKSNNYEVTGIELNNEQVEHAKKVFDVDLINKTFEDFILTNKSSFDIVHLHHVFEHVQNPLEILLDIKKVISKDGLLLLEVPNQFFTFPSQLMFKLRIKSYRKPYNPYHHLYFYSRKTLLEFFKKSGFDVIMLNDQVNRELGIKSFLKLKIASLFKLSTSHVLKIVAKPI